MRSQLMNDVASADPARAVRLDVPEPVWTELAQAVVATDPAPTGTEVAGASHTRRRLRPVVRAATVLAAACAIVAAPVGLGLHGRSSGASAAAATVLSTAAIRAADGPARPDQYWRVATSGGQVTGVESPGTPADAANLWWVSDEGTAYVAVDGSRPTLVDRHQGATRRPVVSAPGAAAPAEVTGTETTDLSPNDLRGSWQTPNAAFLASLPRDPDALRERLYADAEGHGPSDDGEVFVLVADVLGSGIVPADLRSALFTVLETVPGVDLTGDAVTIAGRQGVGVARTEPVDGQRSEIVVDPGTGLLVGTRTVLVDPTRHLPSGTVLSEHGVSTSVVDAIPADLVARAHRSTCTTDAGGGVTCTK